MCSPHPYASHEDAMTSPSQPNTPSGDPAPVQDRPPTSTRAGGPRSVLGIILLVLAWVPTILLVLIILVGWALVLTGDLAASGAVVVTIVCGGPAAGWLAALTWAARWADRAHARRRLARAAAPARQHTPGPAALAPAPGAAPTPDMLKTTPPAPAKPTRQQARAEKAAARRAARQAKAARREAERREREARWAAAREQRRIAEEQHRRRLREIQEQQAAERTRMRPQEQRRREQEAQAAEERRRREQARVAEEPKNPEPVNSTVMDISAQLSEKGWTFTNGNRVSLYVMDKHRAAIHKLVRQHSQFVRHGNGGDGAFAAWGEVLAEPGNRYDSEAVRVLVHGQPVAYFSLDWKELAHDWLHVAGWRSLVVPVVVRWWDQDEFVWAFGSMADAESFAAWATRKDHG